MPSPNLQCPFRVEMSGLRRARRRWRDLEIESVLLRQRGLCQDSSAPVGRHRQPCGRARTFRAPASGRPRRGTGIRLVVGPAPKRSRSSTVRNRASPFIRSMHRDRPRGAVAGCALTGDVQKRSLAAGAHRMVFDFSAARGARAAVVFNAVHGCGGRETPHPAPRPARPARGYRKPGRHRGMPLTRSYILVGARGSAAAPAPGMP